MWSVLLEARTGVEPMNKGFADLFTVADKPYQINSKASTTQENSQFLGSALRCSQSSDNNLACGIRPLGTQRFETRVAVVGWAFIRSCPRQEPWTTTEPDWQVAHGAATRDLLRVKQATSPNTMMTGEIFRHKK